MRTPLRWLDTVPVGRILNRLTSDFEVIDQRLRIAAALVGNHAGKAVHQVRVMVVKALFNEISMLLVYGKDDGLAQPIAAIHFQAMGHQVGQHLVDGVFVEQKLVHFASAHFLRGAIVAPIQ